MDKAVAKQVVETTIKAMPEFTSLVPLLSSTCDAEEFDVYGKTIASIAGRAATDILHKNFGAYPDIEKEIGDKIKRFGKLT